MNIEQELQAEYDRESQLTRKMLGAIPADADLTWKADPKSMTLGRLAGHVAEAAGRWGISVLTENGLDLNSAEFKAFQPATKDEILEKFDTDTAQVRQILAAFDPAKWDEAWKLGSGGRTFFTDTRYRVFRTWVLNHQFHHRAQLGRDLRVLGARIPGMYGPSADES
jgi:uncharacterized damage-inducible protein DinB